MRRIGAILAGRLYVVTPSAEPLTVTYDRVSVTVWRLVSLLVVVAGVGLGAAGPGLVERVVGVAMAAAAAAILWYLLFRCRSPNPRVVVDATGISDWRSRVQAFVPWSSVQRVRFTRGRGRQRIAVTIRDGAPVEGRWPWWMTGWARDNQDIVLADWLVRASLDDIAEAIRRFIPDDSTFEPDPTLRDAVDEFRSWRKQRRGEP